MNILAFVDHESGLRWENLRALVVEDMAAEVRAGYEAHKWPVDVYLWFRSERGPARGPDRFGTRFSFKMIFNSDDPGRFLHACALFGVDAATVPTLS